MKPTGGDYATLALAEAANANLVSLDQQWDIVCDNFEDTTAVNFSGWTTDATRFVRVKAADAHGSTGGITTNSYRLKNAAPLTMQALGVNGFIIFEGIQFWGTAAGQACVKPTINGQAGCKVRLINCVLYSAPASSGYGIIMQETNQPWIVELINCTLVNGYVCILRTAGDLYCYGCTFINTVANQHCLTIGTGTRVIKSCYARCVGGSGTLAYNSTVGAVMDAALSNDASGTVDNVLYTTANFTNVTADTEDLQLPAGSALIGVGADRSAEAAPFNYTTDIQGTTRPLTLDDVGAFQTAAAGGAASSRRRRSIRRRRHFFDYEYEGA